MMGTGSFRWFWLGILWVAYPASQAWSMSILREVKVAEPNRIELSFDRALKKSQFKTEFFRDIVQVSFDEVATYPAKIVNVEEGVVSKIFAYQYTPNVVRCRLTVKGNAEQLQSQVKVSLNGRTLSIHLPNDRVLSDKISVQAAQAMKAPAPSNEFVSPTVSLTDKALLKEVLNKDLSSGSTTSLGLKKEEGSPLRILVLLLIVIMAFVFVAAFLKKASKTKHKGESRRSHQRIFKWLTRWVPQDGNAPGNIRIVATQSLGPNAQIAVVEIGTKRMVLGISNGSINLISTDHSSEEEKEEESFIENAKAPSGATSAGSASFADLLVSSHDHYAPKTPLKGSASVRERIRRRMEGMKSL